MPPQAYDQVSVSNRQRMDHHNQQQQQHQHAPPPLYGAAQGYAYYAAPQYNYNYATMNPPAPAWAYGPPSMVNPVMDPGAPTLPSANAEEPIREPHDNDVLMGRGGKNNQHAGNERLRDMARSVRDRYKASAKKGKSNMSRDLVQQVRDLKPAGRFLKRNTVTNEWEDVGDEIAREKVSQVLRDAVSEWVGPKAAAAAAAKEKQQGDDNEEEDDVKEDEETPAKKPAPATKQESPMTTFSLLANLPPPPAEIPKVAAPAPVPKPKKVPSAVKKPSPPPVLPVLLSPEISDMDDLEDLPPSHDDIPDLTFPVMTDYSLSDDMGMMGEGRERIMSDMTFNDPALDVARAQLESNDDLLSDDSVLGDTTDDEEEEDEDPQSKTAAAAPAVVVQPNPTNRRRPSLKVPVSAVPWNRNKRKTNLLDRYANMSMGLSSSDMSITSIGSQLSSRNLGAQLSSRQLISTGARQMSSRQLSNRQMSSRQLSSRQLSNRQLSSRQLSSRQLSSRQLSGRQLMSAERRKQNFAFMGESDLSLDALSISGDSKSLSRKNIFMDQYLAMDMGLSDFSLGSMAPDTLGGDSNGHAGFHRVSVIVEGDLEDLSEHGSSSTLKLSKHGVGSGQEDRGLQTYSAFGIGTSMSNMTINTIGTFSGHSRRGVFANTGNSMRMESGHSFLTMDDLQLEMLDDELFDEFAEVGGLDEFGIMEEEDEDEFGDEFASEFC